MCVRNLSKDDSLAAGYYGANATQRNGARNRTKRTGISLGHASNPGAPLGRRRSFRPRRQDGGGQRAPPPSKLATGSTRLGLGRVDFSPENTLRSWRFVVRRCPARGQQRERQNVQTGHCTRVLLQDKERNRRQTTSVSNLCVGGNQTERKGRTQRRVVLQLWLCGQNRGIFRRGGQRRAGGLRWGPGRAGDTAKMFWR